MTPDIPGQLVWPTPKRLRPTALAARTPPSAVVASGAPARRTGARSGSATAKVSADEERSPGVAAVGGGLPRRRFARRSGDAGGVALCAPTIRRRGEAVRRRDAERTALPTSPYLGSDPSQQLNPAHSALRRVSD